MKVSRISEKREREIAARQDRARRVNQLTRFISERGRRFFYGKRSGIVAHMVVDPRGRLYWIDDYEGRGIYLHYRYWGKGFNHGGTLEQLVGSFKDYVMTGQLLPLYVFGPWPSWYANSDPWGYGADVMTEIRHEAIALGLLPTPN